VNRKGSAQPPGTEPLATPVLPLTGVVPCFEVDLTRHTIHSTPAVHMSIMSDHRS
jgi:hypothetical protein